MSGGGKIAGERVLDAAQALGAVAVLEKPFALEVLFESVSKALGASEGGEGGVPDSAASLTTGHAQLASSSLTASSRTAKSIGFESVRSAPSCPASASSASSSRALGGRSAGAVRQHSRDRRVRATGAASGPSAHARSGLICSLPQIGLPLCMS